MGKGKKKPDPRGYATTSIASKTPVELLQTAQHLPQSAVAKDAEVTEKIRAAKSNKPTEAPPEVAAEASALKNIKPLPLPPGPDRNAPIVSLSLEEEERLADIVRHWKLTESARNPGGVPSSRFQLETAYETLAEAGFQSQDIEEAMRMYDVDLEKALDWLSLNVPPNRLPLGWYSEQTPSNVQSQSPGGEESLGFASLSEKFRKVEKIVPQSAAPNMQKKSRDLVMIDDVLQQEERQRQAATQLVRKQQLMEETKQLIAAAKLRGDGEESRRLGKLLVEMKDPNYVLQPDRNSDVPTTQPSASEKLLLAGLNEEEIRLLMKGKPEPNDVTKSSESESLVKAMNTTVVELEEERKQGDVASRDQEDTGNKVEEDAPLSLSMFDEDDDSSRSTAIKGAGVSYGLPRFEGSIPASWRSATPKSLLADLVKKQWNTMPKYVRETSGVRVKILSSETELIVFEAGMKCDKHAIEEELAAMRALYVLFKDAYRALEIQLPPDFRETWKSWVAEDAQAAHDRAEMHTKPRRRFVSELLEEQQRRMSSQDSSQTSAPGAFGPGIVKPDRARSAPAWEVKQLVKCLASERRLVNSELPIFSIRAEFLSALFAQDFVVVVGETGSGKTTQIPQFILDGWLEQQNSVPRVAISEPRRVSATSVCKRVSEEMGEEVGIAAYQIRGENTSNAKTCLLFCTTGILLRRAVDDPLFVEFDIIVIDEVHERSLDSDVLMVLVKFAVEERKRRNLSPLKAVLMSATINAERLSDYFGKCPVVRASGRTFPVKQYYLEDAVEMTGYDHIEDREVEEDYVFDEETGEKAIAEVAMEPLKGYSARTRQSLAFMDQAKVNYALIEKTLELVDKLDHHGQGAVLVFLPGMKDILALESRLVGSRKFGNSKEFRIVPLHSSLSNAKQVRLVFDPPPSGVRKIVLSTNIAETGVTIPDVTVVIDTCRVNQISFNEKRGLVILSERFCSKSSADQRTGRAGRVREGIAFRLISKKIFADKLEKFTSPEIHRVPLDQVCLAVLVQHWDPRDFFPRALDPPSPDAITKALLRLEKLGAAVSLPARDKNNSSNAMTVSPLGALLARLPVDAHIGKMVVYGAVFRCCRMACTIAACASAEKSIFRSEERRKVNRLQVLDSDLITDARVFLEWEKSPNRSQFVRENHLDMQRLWEIQSARDQLVSSVSSDLGFTVRDDNSNDWRVVGAVVAAGTSLSQVKFSGSSSRNDIPEHAVRYTCADGTEARLVKSSLAYGQGRGALRMGNDGPKRARFFAYCERIKTHAVFLRDVTPVHPAAVLLLAAAIKPFHLVRRVDIDDGWSHVKCAPRTCAVFSKVRKALDQALLTTFSSALEGKLAREDVVDLAIELLKAAD